MKKPIIGILVTQTNHPNHHKKRTIGIEEPYLHFFSQYAKVIPIMPNTLPGEVKIDLLVLPGGADLDASFTSDGSNLVVGNGPANPYYSQFYKHSFKAWRKAAMPMLGICLGLQALNVMLGGTVTSDGPEHNLTFTSRHPIVAYNRKLSLYSEKGEMPINRSVNSRHHQFIRPHDLAECLLPVAMGVMDDDSIKTPNLCKEVWGYETAVGSRKKVPNLIKHFVEGNLDSINPKLTHVEAVIHVSEKICGVQWHPEDMYSRADPFDRGDIITHRMIGWLLNKTTADISAEKAPSSPVITHETV